MINILMNQTRTHRFSKLPDDGDPWAPNNLLTPELKKTLLSEGLSEPEFYGDLVYKFKKLIESNDFSFQIRKIITRYRRICYSLNVMRQSAFLVFNPITVDNYAAFFNCTPVGRASDSMMALT